MINIKELTKALKQVSEEKGLKIEKAIEVIESSIAAAYKKEYGERGEIIKCELDQKTGALKFWQIKTVVDDSVVRFQDEDQDSDKKEDIKLSDNAEQKLPLFNSDRNITIEEALKIKKDAKIGDEIIFPLETKEEFGRIAAQTAKQVILQRLRESERESILSEWYGKEGQIVSGIVQRFEKGNVFVDLGRTVGIMFSNESIPGEHYRSGERLRFLVLNIQDDTRLPGIVLSRAAPKFISELFKLEVPELAENVIEIKSIAREPGNRTKIGVSTNNEGVDPVGTLVGQRGMRVNAVNNELGNERIDIIEWSDDPKKLIANSLSPARVEKVELLEKNEARVFVPESQLSLAIGKGGQNVRLAAKLIGWKIDVRSESQPDKIQNEEMINDKLEDGINDIGD